MANQYSAKVVLQLAVGGLTLSLSHVGPSGLVIRDECQPMPSSGAKILISVDDQVSVREVVLPHGITGPRQPIMYF